jgi:hypothetical protein
MFSGEKNPMFGRSAAEKMSAEEYDRWCKNIASGNRKPKSKTEGYKRYASQRKWIVNKEGKLAHCTSLDDPRLLSGEYRLGKKWQGDF